MRHTQELGNSTDVRLTDICNTALTMWWHFISRAKREVIGFPLGLSLWHVRAGLICYLPSDVTGCSKKALTRLSQFTFLLIVMSAFNQLGNWLVNLATTMSIGYACCIWQLILRMHSTRWWSPVIGARLKIFSSWCAWTHDHLFMMIGSI